MWLINFALSPLAVVPKINAHARVGMKLVDTLAGQMPIGVPDVNPQSGAVIFYDEANPGNVNTTWAKYLRKINTANGFNEWSNTDATGVATPASVTMPPSGQLGAVMAFSSDGPPTRHRLTFSGCRARTLGTPGRAGRPPGPRRRARGPAAGPTAAGSPAAGAVPA